jgi:SprT protein
MNIPPDLHNQVRAVVLDSIARVEAVYPDLNLPPLIITYQRSYTTAGWARGIHYHVNFDPILLSAYPSAFLYQIVPHEVAHVITEHIHGHDTQAHGKEWKAIMILMGLKPDRCHGLDTNISKRQFTTYKFLCACNDDSHVYASIMRRKIMLDKYQCVACKTRLVPSEPVHVPTSMPEKIAFGTKKDKAIWIIKRNKDRSRKTVIKKLVRDAGLTEAGASTYYHNLTKKS